MKPECNWGRYSSDWYLNLFKQKLFARYSGACVR